MFANGSEIHVLERIRARCNRFKVRTVLETRAIAKTDVPTFQFPISFKISTKRDDENFFFWYYSIVDDSLEKLVSAVSRERANVTRDIEINSRAFNIPVTCKRHGKYPERNEGSPSDATFCYSVMKALAVKWNGEMVSRVVPLFPRSPFTESH